MDNKITNTKIVSRFNVNMKKSQLLHDIIKDRDWYLFIIPGVVFFIIFRYIPLYFLQVAFKDYRISKSIGECAWVGFKYFYQLFDSAGFLDALRNTLLISIYKIAFGFPVPIILALLLNEIYNVKFKRITQTIIYLPHFISWSIVAGMVYNFLSIDGGVINNLRVALGGERFMYMASMAHFRGIAVGIDIVKNAGWGTILYLAAITAINPELYESAVIDGANKFRQIWSITLPGIMDIVIVLLILNIGHLLDAGFEQIFVLMNDAVKPVADIIDTYVYRTGILQGRYSYAAAAGVFKSVVAAIMLFSTDFTAKRIGQKGLF